MAEVTAAAAETSTPETKLETLRNPNAILSMDQLKQVNVVEMAKDKFLCRTLQRCIQKGGPEAAKHIFGQVEPQLMELVRDQYGNYLVQKLLEVTDPPEVFEKISAELRPRLVELATDGHGTRAVQKFVDQAALRGEKAALLAAFPAKHSTDTAKNVCGFHVVVKLLEVMDPGEEIAPYAEDLCGVADRLVDLGCDQWGCCVLKKCMDRVDGERKTKLLDGIVSSCASLVENPFGNYVVQHAILNGDPFKLCGRLIEVLQGKAFDLCMLKFSSNVLEKCILNADEERRVSLVSELLKGKNDTPAGAAKKLLQNQFGNYVLQQALASTSKDTPQYTELIEAMKPWVAELILAKADYEEPKPAGKKSKDGKEVEDTPEQAEARAMANSRRLAAKLAKKYPALGEGVPPNKLQEQLALLTVGQGGATADKGKNSPQGKKGGGGGAKGGAQGKGGGKGKGGKGKGGGGVVANAADYQAWAAAMAKGQAFGIPAGPGGFFPPNAFGYAMSYPMGYQVDPYTGGYTVPISPWPMAYPAAIPAPGGEQATKKKRTRGRKNKSGEPSAGGAQSTEGTAADSAAAPAGNATPSGVGRIIGFWPHYSISYVDGSGVEPTSPGGEAVAADN